MKKLLPLLAVAAAALASAAGCKSYDYFSHVSDVVCDIFCAETEEFSLTVSCAEREYPYLADGVAAPRTRTVEAVLREHAPSGAEYEIYFLEDVPRGGDMSYRSVSGDYFYSRGAESFPERSVSLRVVRDGAAQDLLATSVKTESTLSPEAALRSALGAERETVGALTRGGTFRGEFHVRLLRRDVNYYYVGILGGNGERVSLLLDSETGEILARRETG